MTGGEGSITALTKIRFNELKIKKYYGGSGMKRLISFTLSLVLLSAAFFGNGMNITAAGTKGIRTETRAEGGETAS